jgi:histidinol-phosphatase
MTDDLSIALALADAADEISMKWYRSSALSVQTKADRTPVSMADLEAERAMREILKRMRPEDGIVGEEFGVSRGERRWILDPIDGTKNYIRGIPVFATLIALEGEAGVISAPALGRRWWASRGNGAFCNGQRIGVSAVSDLDAAYLAYDSITDFDQAGSTDRFLALVRRCGRTRAFGDFWAHMLVAEGAMDVAIEPAVAIWDMAPVQVIVEEAGGRFTDLGGNARPDGGSAVSTNGKLHDAVLEALR